MERNIILVPSHPDTTPVVFSTLLSLFLCLVSSVSSANPALSVVGVSTNTGATGDTVVNAGSYTYGKMITFSSLTSIDKELYVYATFGTSSVGLTGIYTFDGRLVFRNADSLSNLYSFDYKDPLKLIMGHWNVQEHYEITLQEDTTNKLLAQVGPVIIRTNTKARCGRVVLVPNTEYLIASHGVDIGKVDLTNPANDVGMTFTDANFALDLDYHPKNTNLIIACRSSTILYIIDGTTLIIVRQYTTTTAYYEAIFDNLNTQKDFYVLAQPATGLAIYKIDPTEVATSITILTNWDLSSLGGAVNSILNFGPYQYVVTIPK